MKIRNSHLAHHAVLRGATRLIRGTYVLLCLGMIRAGEWLRSFVKNRIPALARWTHLA